MSYIGSTPTTQSFIAGTDYFNGNGSTVNFTLSRSVNSVNDIEVIVNNVEQIPSGYSVSGTTLTFSAAPSAGTSNVYVRYLSTTNLGLAIPAGTSATFNTVTVADGSATTPSITNDGDTNTGIFFPAADTIAFAEGGVESMRIDSSGNVGIGSNSIPGATGAKLYAIGATTAVDSSGQIFAGSSDAFAADKGGQIMMGAYYTSTLITALGGFAAKKENATSGNFAGYLQFLTSTNGSGNTEKARIDSSGNLLVGQTALNGAGKVEISYDRASSWGMQIRNTTGTTAATTFIEFKYVNSTVGYIGSTNGTSTQYNTSSDYRLKENIAPMIGALAKVVALKPVTYKWKSTGMVDEGFIAHELAEVCPSAVTGTKDAVDADGNPVHQGIDTSFLVATLTAAIQEQQALITQLQADVAALKAQ
jgi:hypothetical protein